MDVRPGWANFLARGKLIMFDARISIYTRSRASNLFEDQIKKVFTLICDTTLEIEDQKKLHYYSRYNIEYLAAGTLPTNSAGLCHRI